VRTEPPSFLPILHLSDFLGSLECLSRVKGGRGIAADRGEGGAERRAAEISKNVLSASSRTLALFVRRRGDGEDEESASRLRGVGSIGVGARESWGEGGGEGMEAFDGEEVSLEEKDESNFCGNEIGVSLGEVGRFGDKARVDDFAKGEEGEEAELGKADSSSSLVSLCLLLGETGEKGKVKGLGKKEEGGLVMPSSSFELLLRSFVLELSPESFLFGGDSCLLLPFWDRGESGWG
jgi:hypothetical protein